MCVSVDGSVLCSAQIILVYLFCLVCLWLLGDGIFITNYTIEKILGR